MKDNGKALTKFLRTLNVKDDKKILEAFELLDNWSAIELEDALPLLSCHFAANSLYNKNLIENSNAKKLIELYNKIRTKAIVCLDKADTLVIKSILLQLIQAYRYECFEQNLLKDFFFRHVFKSLDICNSFYWLIHLEKENVDDPDREDTKQY